MYLLLEVDDAAVYNPSKMPNLPKVLDKAIKTQRQKLINDLVHERAVFLSFETWFLAQTKEQRELTMKNIRSTIDVNEFVPKELKSRELIIEAINRYRENLDQNDSGEGNGTDTSDEVQPNVQGE